MEKQKISFVGFKNNDKLFVLNKLHRFDNISQQCGLFASLSRPLWMVKCNGCVVGLYHRMRHAAISGGKDVPISVFLQMSSGHSVNNNNDVTQRPSWCPEGFLTVHERIGRVGSQRLTLYNG